MRIFFCEVFHTYTAKTTMVELKQMGHIVSHHIYPTPENIHSDADTTERIAADVKEQRPDVVFTINFWGVVAEACHDLRVAYISWGYDSPMEIRDISPMRYETNRIFLFDRTECEKFRRMGVTNVFYSTLAAQVKEAGRLKAWSKPLEISLVGSIYESAYPVLRAGMDGFESGYVDAVVAAQQRIYEGYIIPELLTEEIVTGINRSYADKASSSPPMRIETAELSYAIATELTHRERILLLALLSARFSTTLFTFRISEEDQGILSRVHVEKAVDYETEMPRVFSSSKINLNPILKANGNGIPLRALDVLSCGGFLLSSWREDFLNYFVPDEEVVFYTSIEDAVEKAEFYMRNDDVRERIARTGRERIRKDFSYVSRLQLILEKI